MPTTPPHVQESLAAMLAAEPAYKLAADYFEGRVQEVFSSRKLRAILGPTGYRYRVNFARTPVDVLLERTTMNAIEGSDDKVIALLNEVWDANELGLEAKDLHRRTYEFGDAYIIGWPSDELPGGVEAYCHDPHSVRVFYDVQRPRIKSHAVHTWVEKNPDGLGDGFYQRVNVYFPDYVEQWVTSTRIDVEGRVTSDVRLTDRQFVPYITDDAPEGIVDNPTPGIIPVFHFRTARPYGRPEHADAYGPQDMINKLNITMMSAVDFAGFPQRYVLTDSSLDPMPEDSFGLPEYDPGVEQSLPGLDADSSLQAGPGETWVLSGAKLSVGQFQVADTANFLNASSAMIRQMASVCDIPAYYFDSSGQMPSGESFRRAEAPLNKKLDDRLALLGVTWHEFFNYCLAVNSMAPSDAFISWQPPEVYSDDESWQTALSQQQAGVSREQTLKERGYSDDLIEEMLSNTPPDPGLA